jgi:hypothetical protein
MTELLALIATLSAALFAGAALYITVVEHPARMQLDTRAAAAQWAPSYQRATRLQAPLAVISALAGSGAWWADGGAGWLVAALLIGAVVPFTLIVIMPTNHRLQAPDRDPAAPETRALLQRWARLHAVRTLLSLIALTLDLILLRSV